MGSLKSRDGKVIGDEEGMKNRWREYSEELYSEDKRIEKEQTDTTDFEMEPEVMEAEVEWAIKQLKDNKAPGQDGMPIELIKAGEDATIKIITKICNNIWKTGKWPEDWKESTFIPIFKKGDARSCDNYRTIALISHTSKILLKIIHKRMESTIERELPDNQAGFRKARGTRDHIANMRWIMERQLEHGKEVHICFIDYSKAFDCTNHELLWKTLLEMGIPKHLIQLLKGLYEDQSAVIRTEFGDTNRFKIKKEVRTAGLHLVPYLIQPVRREDNEKGRNGRGKGRSENSRKDTEQLEICRSHNTDGRKKIGSDKTNKKADERKRKGGPIFQHKEDKDYDNSQLGQL